MPVYRYKRTGLSIAKVKAQVPPADAASVSAGSIGPTQVWDITAPTTSLDDLNDYMASMGWEYDSTDPSETPAEQSAGDQSHGDLGGVTADQHHNRQHAIGAAADHTSATLAQLNALVSDATLDDSSDTRDPNSHALGGAAHSADTLANLNTKISDATLDDSSDPRDPNSHASSHQSAGGDSIKLDDLAAPDDNTDLNSTTSAHGLLPKLGGGTTNFLRADGSWSAPAGGSGEINTASNVGTGGVGVFKQKTGVDLEFKKVNAGSAKITITDDTGNDEVDIDVVTGTDANSVCVGNDSRLSNDRTASGIRTATTVVSVSGATAPTSGQVLKATSGTNATWQDESGGSSIVPHKMFQADQMESPNSSDWKVNALAPLIPDANDLALSVRAFDDSAEEGIGFTARVPTGATNMILGFLGRAATAPGAGSDTVALNLYSRAVPDNATIPSWSTETSLTDISIPTNAYYQKDSQTIAISTLGLTAGVTYTFELTRDFDDGDDLSGDWLLHSLTVGWS